MLEREKNIIQTQEKEFKDIFLRIKKRDFSGNSGLAIKNSLYQFSTTLVAKIGSLLFTIILARLLLPEMFGLYSLALSTIIVIASFSDLGIANTLVKFISKSLSKNNKKEAKAYFSYLLKIKAILIIFSSLILLIFASFLANNYYQKPIFLALLAGSLYILFIGFMNFFDFIFQSNNNFKPSFFKEIIFQSLRLILIPLIVLCSINKFSSETTIMFIILGLSLCFFIALLFIFLSALKKISFLKEKKISLKKNQKKEVNKVFLLLATTVLSGIFLGYVDIVILGKYVSAEYIGYYQAALALIGGLYPLISFSIVLLPIFSRLSKEQLKHGFKKAMKIIFLISLALLVLTFFLSKFIILIAYGKNYILSSLVLKVFAINLLILPLCSLYEAYFITIGKPQILAKYLIISTILNLILVFVFVNYALNTLNSEYYAIIGSAIAVVISRGFYLLMQGLSRRSL